MDPYHHELGMAVPTSMMPLLSDRRVGKQNLVDPHFMQGKYFSGQIQPLSIFSIFFSCFERD